MAEDGLGVVGRATIELIADGRKLKAGIDEAKRAARTLGEGQREISRAAQRAIDQYIGRLEIQNQTIGRSSREVELFKLAVRGASNEQLASADKALQGIERQRAAIAAAADLQRRQDEAGRSVVREIAAERARADAAEESRQQNINRLREDSIRILRRFALAALAAATAAAAFVARNINFADSLKDLSASTNISVENLAGLDLLARQSGTNIQFLARAINRMTVEMGKAPQEFRDLGITATEPLQAFGQLADLFNSLTSIEQRNALANQVFGRSWQEIAPALKEGSNRIAEIIERGRELSRLNEGNAEAAARFDDRIQELTTSFRALGLQALPTLTRIANRLVAAAENADGFVDAAQRALSISGAQAADPSAAIAEIDRTLAALRKNAEAFDRSGVFGRIFNIRGFFDKGTIRELEEQRDVLVRLQRLQTEGQNKTEGQQNVRALENERNAARERSAAVARFLKEGQEQVKLTREIAQAATEGIQKGIELELQLRQAQGLAADRQLNVRRDVDRAELDAIQKRIKAAQDAQRIELDIIQRSNVTDQEALRQRLAAGNRLYDTLIQRANDYLRVSTDAQRRILALDDELVESRKRTAEFVKEIERSRLPPPQQRDALIRDAGDAEAKLRSAVLSGDVQKQKELADEGLRYAQALRAAGEIDFAQRFAEDIQRLRELGVEAQKFVANVTKRAADDGLANLKTQIAELQGTFAGLRETALTQMQVSASDSSLRAFVARIKETLEREEFTIRLQPQIGSGSVPSFAAGGRALPGVALVGEEGEELAVGIGNRKRALLGVGGPQIVRFLQPAYVHTARETRKIFNEINGQSVRTMAGGGFIAPANVPAIDAGDGDVMKIDLSNGKKTIRVQTRREQGYELVEMMKEALAGT